MSQKLKLPYTVTMEAISPEDAIAYLKKNPRNRALSSTLSDRYGEMMATGEWMEETGDAIRFNCDGTLIDGQHRLDGIRKSGKTINMLVIRGLPRDSFKYIDDGKKRSSGDTLGAAGESNYNTLAAGIRWHGVIAHRRSWKQMAVSRKKLFEVLKKHPGLRESAAHVVNTKANTVASSGILTACHYIFAQLDKDMADKFITDLGTGEGLKRTDPVYVLRERFRRNRAEREKLPPNCVAAFVIKAWNATRRGDSIKKLVWLAEEPFPVVQ